MNANETDPHVFYLEKRESQRKALHRIQSQIGRHEQKGVKAWVASFIANLKGTWNI
ncbi:hypothetical protein L479_02746 [Exiguobacterium sp. S17]|nr:hypothetical protein L479_02746 [Exiguobacterium sp. S17]